MIESLLACIVAYGIARGLYETYHAIRLAGFERGLQAAEEVIDRLAKTAYQAGRLHERAAMQSEVQAIYKEAYRQGRLSTIAPTIFERN